MLAFQTEGKDLTALRLMVGVLLCSAYCAAQDSPPTLTTLYNFGGGDGSNPGGAVVVGSGGVLYGVTYYGGTNDLGTVFALTPPALPGGAWTESVLHSFGAYRDGANPDSPMVIGSGGVLYGSTVYGGNREDGTVFSLTPPPSPVGQWTEAVLHRFTGDGPPSGVTISPDGVLYGTTGFGGSSNFGTVYELAPPASPGGAWRMKVLYSFTYDSGVHPQTGVAIGSGKVLFGTTPSGGAFNCGTIYALAPPAVTGGAWTETLLYTFTGGADGGMPLASPVIGKGGILYGTTTSGGSSVGGTLFSLTPPVSAGGSWTYAVLHDFPFPYNAGPLVIGEGGVLYGTGAAGSAFILQPPTAAGDPWTYGLLAKFTGSDGYVPMGLTFDGGILYGTTYKAGDYGFGTVFQLARY